MDWIAFLAKLKGLEGAGDLVSFVEKHVNDISRESELLSKQNGRLKERLDRLTELLGDKDGEAAIAALKSEKDALATKLEATEGERDLIKGQLTERAIIDEIRIKKPEGINVDILAEAVANKAITGVLAIAPDNSITVDGKPLKDYVLPSYVKNALFAATSTPAATTQTPSTQYPSGVGASPPASDQPSALKTIKALAANPTKLAI